MTPPDIKQLVRDLGGPNALGRKLKISHNAIVAWPHVPAARVKAVVAIAAERGYKHEGKPLTMAMLRPDLF